MAGIANKRSCPGGHIYNPNVAFRHSASLIEDEKIIEDRNSGVSQAPYAASTPQRAASGSHKRSDYSSCVSRMPSLRSEHTDLAGGIPNSLGLCLLFAWVMEDIELHKDTGGQYHCPLYKCSHHYSAINEFRIHVSHCPRLRKGKFECPVHKGVQRFARPMPLGPNRAMCAVHEGFKILCRLEIPQLTLLLSVRRTIARLLHVSEDQVDSLEPPKEGHFELPDREMLILDGTQISLSGYDQKFKSAYPDPTVKIAASKALPFESENPDYRISRPELGQGWLPAEIHSQSLYEIGRNSTVSPTSSDLSDTNFSPISTVSSSLTARPTVSSQTSTYCENAQLSPISTHSANTLEETSVSAYPPALFAGTRVSITGNHNVVSHGLPEVPLSTKDFSLPLSINTSIRDVELAHAEYEEGWQLVDHQADLDDDGQTLYEPQGFQSQTSSPTVYGDMLPDPPLQPPSLHQASGHESQSTLFERLLNMSELLHPSFSENYESWLRSTANAPRAPEFQLPNHESMLQRGFTALRIICSGKSISFAVDLYCLFHFSVASALASEQFAANEILKDLCGEINVWAFELHSPEQREMFVRIAKRLLIHAARLSGERYFVQNNFHQNPPSYTSCHPAFMNLRSPQAGVDPCARFALEKPCVRMCLYFLEMFEYAHLHDPSNQYFTSDLNGRVWYMGQEDARLYILSNLASLPEFKVFLPFVQSTCDKLCAQAFTNIRMFELELIIGCKQTPSTIEKYRAFADITRHLSLNVEVNYGILVNRCIVADIDLLEERLRHSKPLPSVISSEAMSQPIVQQVDANTSDTVPIAIQTWTPEGDHNGSAVNPESVKQNITEATRLELQPLVPDIHILTSSSQDVDEDKIEGRCPECDKLFTGKAKNVRANIKRHLEEAHNPNPKRYQCMQCPESSKKKTFSRISNLHAHEREHHNGPQPTRRRPKRKTEGHETRAQQKNRRRESGSTSGRLSGSQLSLDLFV